MCFISVICNLANSCRQIQTLYLRRCLNITDVAIETVARRCPQLRYLNIGGCTLITDASLKALGENCKFLRSINVSGTQVWTPPMPFSHYKDLINNKTSKVKPGKWDHLYYKFIDFWSYLWGGIKKKIFFFFKWNSFKFYLFYNDYETSYTTYINHARWHWCFRMVFV